MLFGAVTVTPGALSAWDTPDYGASAADDVIEKVTQSIRYGPTMRVELTGLVPGSTYKLQLLFFEQCCENRGFNVLADGKVIAQDFSPPEIQGGVNNIAAGAVISAEFVTQLDKLIIVLTVNGRTREDLIDPNAILDGLTLEVLKEVAAPAAPTLSLTKAANGTLTITTDSTLEAADAVTGPFTALPDKSITVDPKTAGPQKFYRSKK